jgi:hypothetical protein
MEVTEQVPVLMATASVRSMAAVEGFTAVATDKRFSTSATVESVWASELFLTARLITLHHHSQKAAVPQLLNNWINPRAWISVVTRPLDRDFDSILADSQPAVQPRSGMGGLGPLSHIERIFMYRTKSGRSIPADVMITTSSNPSMIVFACMMATSQFYDIYC